MLRFDFWKSLFRDRSREPVTLVFGRRLSGPASRGSVQLIVFFLFNLVTGLRVRFPVPTKSKLIKYQLYIRSVLTYAGPVWVPHISKSNWSGLQAVQNINLRIIAALPPYDGRHDTVYIYVNLTMRGGLKRISAHKKSVVLSGPPWFNSYLQDQNRQIIVSNRNSIE